VQEENRDILVLHRQGETVVSLTLPEFREQYPDDYAQSMRLYGALMEQYAIREVRVRLKDGRPVRVDVFMSDLRN